MKRLENLIKLAKEKYSENAYAYKNLGIISRSLGNEVKAIDYLKTALKLNFTEQYGTEVVELLKNHTPTS